MTRQNRIGLWLWLFGCLLASRLLAAEPKPFDCLMEPIVMTEVGNPVQGMFTRWLVDRSNSVTPEQPIIKIEAGAETINLNAAMVRANMQSEILVREADLVLAKLNLDRMRQRHKQQLVPTQKWVEANAQKLVAAADMALARERLKLVRVESERAAQLMAHRKPFAVPLMESSWRNRYSPESSSTTTRFSLSQS